MTILRSFHCGLMLLGVLFAANARPAAAQQPTGFLDRAVRIGDQEFPYQVYVPRDYGAAERWPVILFLHGSGERGRDGVSQTVAGLGPAIRNNPAQYPAIVVLPQAPRDSLWMGVPADAAMIALEQTLTEFSTDPGRIYLTGLSMGGNGTWYLAYRHPERFAAVVPICGWVSGDARLPASVVPAEDGEPFEALARRLQGVPIWIFHGELDPVVPADQSRQAAAAFEALGVEVRYTEFLGTDHNSWDAAYGSVQFTQWLFAQQR